jgi:DNA-binding response OmpR family regulator
MDAELLMVEDDDGIAAPLLRTLTREGYAVTRVATGREALEEVRRSPPDMVVLDLGLPDMDGLDVCRTLRATGFAAPILILTARGSELDQVVGLDAGADDYLAKPFGLAVLLARTRALLRRGPADGAAGADQATAAPGPTGMRVDEAARRVWMGDEEVFLSTKEFEVIALLAQNTGAVVTRERFMEEIWDEHWFGSTKTLDVTVGRLRHKLEVAGADVVITAVRGVGYRLDPPGA